MLIISIACAELFSIFPEAKQSLNEYKRMNALPQMDDVCTSRANSTCMHAEIRRIKMSMPRAVGELHTHNHTSHGMDETLVFYHPNGKEGWERGKTKKLSVNTECTLIAATYTAYHTCCAVRIVQICSIERSALNL